MAHPPFEAPIAATPATDAPERREQLLARMRLAIAGLLGVLIVALGWQLLQAPFTLLAAMTAALSLAIAAGLVAYQRLSSDAASRRVNRDASLTRILQGLSRSVSPESVVEAIIQELRVTSGADHVVVARVRRPDQVVEVTLVSARAAVPNSMTYLRPEISVTGAAEHAGGERGESPHSADGTAEESQVLLQAAADEIARRVRSGYGFSNLLTLPLVHERRFLGALILSRRTRTPWSEDDRRLLEWAAEEVSAAFGRAYAHEEAERGANIDPLTGLPNRRYFDELVAILRPGRRSGDRTGIVMVDADRFKRVNDTYGHATGDVVLRQIANAITASVRAEDTPARFGGEEFVVILRRASAGQAADVGERIRAAVAALPTRLLGVNEPVTVSVGVAVSKDAEEIRALIERADRALYVAKRRGRDRVEVA